MGFHARCLCHPLVPGGAQRARGVAVMPTEAHESIGTLRWLVGYRFMTGFYSHVHKGSCALFVVVQAKSPNSRGQRRIRVYIIATSTYTTLSMQHMGSIAPHGALRVAVPWDTQGVAQMAGSVTNEREPGATFHPWKRCVCVSMSIRETLGDALLGATAY